MAECVPLCCSIRAVGGGALRSREAYLVSDDGRLSKDEELSCESDETITDDGEAIGQGGWVCAWARSDIEGVSERVSARKWKRRKRPYGCGRRGSASNGDCAG